MNRDEKDIEEQIPGFEEPEEKKPMSALDAINASFNQKTMEAGSSSKPRKEYKKEAGKEDRKKDLDDRKQERKWNIITGVLVAIIIVVAAMIILTLQREARGTNQAETGPAQSGSVQVNSEPQTPAQKDSSGETETDRETEPPSETKKESETVKQSETEETKPSESQTETRNNSSEETETTAVPEEYKNILSADEQKNWQEKGKDSSKVFIQLNQKIEVSDPQRVYLRLINPPYSVYGIQIKIYLNDDQENILYQSERLEPGEILEYVSFNSSPSQGSHPATVEYTVYSDTGTSMGDYKVNITVVGK